VPPLPPGTAPGTTPDDLVERARFGDRDAFDALVTPELPRLRRVVRRMVGDPDDTSDLVQDALLRAYEKIGSFRGDASLTTWLVSIATRAAIDHLRKRARWRDDAQVHARQYLHDDGARYADLQTLFRSPDYMFDAREHIAFCFTCVGRSLPPEQQAALILRDVLQYKNGEAAKLLGLTESVLRHHLADARRSMQKSFDGLCGIVNKDGVCHQCSGLRDAAPEAGRGPTVPELGGRDAPAEAQYKLRLNVVRDADVDGGATQGFHDMVWRALSVVEQQAAR